MQPEEVLSKGINTKDRCHAYLFVSPDRDFLRATVSSFIARHGCLRQDVSEVEPTSETGKSGQILVDDIRTLIHAISLSPHGETRVGVIHQAEKLNNSSGNILLKTLEEPPLNVTLILTASSSNVLPTIKSRCRIIRLNRMAKKESITFSYNDFVSQPLAHSFKRAEDVVKSGQVKEFLQDLTQQFEDKLLSNHDDYSISVLERIMQAQRNIARNVNPRLILENLIILMKYNNGK